MIPTQAFIDSIGTLLAADPAGFADPTTFLKVALAKAAFTPGAGLELTDLTVADFGGYAALHAANATPHLYTDPLTGEQLIVASDPTGGWHWQASSDTNLPQTIYGYYVTDHSGANLLGSGLLDTPVPLAAVGDGLDIGSIGIRISSVLIS